MIRKERKAHWTYRCSPCDYTSPASVDLFGAQEWQQRHERANIIHFQNGIVEAFRPLVEFVKKFASAAEQYQTDYTLIPPPSNIPHDPALLKDRRKWGGR
ncbi:hypothetical protein PP357_gp58 [Arthrobacter phage Sarge]|uniref:Uncharacterized protein n=1 Tax=Arthrobacter phage Sarge TaxID=2885974 RepID=A0AAE9C1K2_9CAUD|nr:hypothetical protein PP357_gp58 [Arthrobacter phage Sarge]UDL14905.1 hypothetical protein SEA_SARGE_58 [Arthrobacter phage Sarge]